MPKNIQIDGSKITDWDSFHDQFSETLGFPGFYGRNMNAWNDCMTSLDAPDDGLSSVHVTPGDVLVLCISGVGRSQEEVPRHLRCAGGVLSVCELAQDRKGRAGGSCARVSLMKGAPNRTPDRGRKELAGAGKGEDT